MAEVIAVIGVMASAGQLLAYSCVIGKSLKDFYERVKTAPEKYQSQANQVRQLVFTAELIRGTEALDTPLISSHLETILGVIRSLDATLKKALNESCSGSKRRYWSAIRASKREEKISRGFAVLEESKSNLVLCILGTYGNVFVPALRTTLDSVGRIEDAINNRTSIMPFRTKKEPKTNKEKEKEKILSSLSSSSTETADESSDSDASSATSFATHNLEAQSKGSVTKSSYSAGAPVSETSKRVRKEKTPIAGRMVPPNQDHETTSVRKRNRGKKSWNSGSRKPPAEPTAPRSTNDHVQRSGNHFGKINLGAGSTAFMGSLGPNVSSQVSNNRFDEISTSNGGPIHSFMGHIHDTEMVKTLVESWRANPIPKKQEAHCNA